MAKRSAGAFKRVKGDYYRTWDPRAVAPLLPELPPGCPFIEPCAGDGILAHHLVVAGHELVFASDVEPKDRSVGVFDALDLNVTNVWDWATGPAGISLGRMGDLKIITNPAWARPLLHELISHFARIADTWVLFDADWAHTEQAPPLLAFCHRIVAVGRVKWFEGSRWQGKDNAAWYNFDLRRPRRGAGPVFVNRRGEEQ
jgi:hypothetical protein